jgi:hypothetical protein
LPLQWLFSFWLHKHLILGGKAMVQPYHSRNALIPMRADFMLHHITRKSTCDVLRYRFCLDLFSMIIHGPSGMDGSERNTGTPHDHPSAVKRERSAAGLALTRSRRNVWSPPVWYGTILIGVPPKPFTGEFFRAFVTPTHSSRHLSPVQHWF